MLSKIHLAATGLFLATAVTFGGLWLRGSAARPEAPPEAPSADDPGGRYRIEKVDDARRIIDAAGSLGFFGANVLEAWAFKYSGGYLQVQLETDFNGSVAPGDWLPPDWPSRLASNDGARENQAAAFRKEGYVLLTAMPSAMSAEELFHLYAPQLCGALGSGLTGPFHALLPLHLQALQKRPYRLFLSVGPSPGFKEWTEYLLPVREPVVPRDLASEGGHVGGGKNLEAGKDITLLDRTRGNSRVRLKARFLGDGEVRDLATKTGN
jgi:hypothetical protein